MHTYMHTLSNSDTLQYKDFFSRNTIRRKKLLYLLIEHRMGNYSISTSKVTTITIQLMTISFI